MGCRNRHLIISLLFLLVSSLTHESFLAEGRAISKLAEIAQTRKVLLAERVLIGSRPPRCQRRCSSCGHCEAIQVPVVPQLKAHPTTHPSATPTVAYSRGDDISNYKPMSWKCKCGDLIFTP